MYEYVGNLHIHTAYSDGHGTVAEVARAAKRTGLDFVGLADHYHLLPHGIPYKEGGYRAGVLVCMGTELHESHSHLLAWGTNGDPLPADETQPQTTIDAVNAQGGIGFLAHPFDRGTPLHDAGHSFAWRDWSVVDFTGLSIWSLGAEWKRISQTRLQFARHTALRRTAPIDPVADDLARWDALNRTRRVVGIGASDNHAVPLRALGGLVRLRFLPHTVAFRSVNTHVLLPQPWTGEADADARALYGALKSGRCFVANHQRGDARGFRYTIRGPETCVLPGDAIRWQPGLRIHAVAPARGSWRVIAQGRTVFAMRGRAVRWPIPGPGAYRVEVRRSGLAGRDRAWIFSNHIRVTP